MNPNEWKFLGGVANLSLKVESTMKMAIIISMGLSNRSEGTNTLLEKRNLAFVFCLNILCRLSIQMLKFYMYLNAWQIRLISCKCHFLLRRRYHTCCTAARRAEAEDVKTQSLNQWSVNLSREYTFNNNSIFVLLEFLHKSTIACNVDPHVHTRSK